MRKEDAKLLTPGTKVQIGSRLLGGELYGWEDPSELKQFLGTIGTVVRVNESHDSKTYTVEIEENGTGTSFILEEIEYIVPETELEESDSSISDLLGL